MDRLNYTTLFLALPIVLGFISIYRIRTSTKIMVLGLLLYVLGTELIVALKIQGHNSWYYNIVDPLLTSLSLLIVSTFSQNKKVKTICKMTAILCLIAAFVNYRFGQGPTILNTYNIFTFDLILSIISYLIIRKGILTAFKIPPIGVAFIAANIFYFVISAVVMASIPLLNDLDLKMSYKIYQINMVAYCIWSLIIASGFIWKTK